MLASPGSRTRILSDYSNYRLLIKVQPHPDSQEVWAPIRPLLRYIAIEEGGWPAGKQPPDKLEREGRGAWTEDSW